MAATEMDDARRTQLEERLELLDKVRSGHRRSQHRAPWALLTCVLSIPASFLWGPAAAFYVLVIGVSFMCIVFYVAYNHEAECETEQDAIRVMLGGGAAAMAAAEDAEAGHSTTGGTTDNARSGAERDKQRAQHNRNRRPRSISL